MELEDKISLSKIRLETAKSCLDDAEILLNAGSYKSSTNRSYYAVFHSMRVVLALDEIDSKKHSGVISEFRKLYIKTGILKNEISKIIDKAFTVRTHSDYNDFYVISKEDTVKQFEQAKTMLETVERYLLSIYN